MTVSDADRNKAVVARYYEELMNAGRVEILDDLFSKEFLDQQLTDGIPQGRAGMTQVVRAWHRGFPDFSEEVEDMVAEGDRVAARFRFSGTHTGNFFGVPATGRSAEMSGMEMFRLKDGRITDLWYAEQMYELLTALGAVPPLQAA